MDPKRSKSGLAVWVVAALAVVFALIMGAMMFFMMCKWFSWQERT